MAGALTTNYKLPTYAAQDAPDLTGAYNQAMVKIDTQMKANADGAANAKSDAASANSAASAAKSTADKALQKATSNEVSISALTARVDGLESGSFSPSADDATLTVTQLSSAKVTKAGIVYFKSV